MKCCSRKYVLRSFGCTSQPFCSLQVITKSVLYPRFLKSELASKFLMDQSFRAEFKRFQLY